jgi:hypothetical protein
MWQDVCWCSTTAAGPVRLGKVAGISGKGISWRFVFTNLRVRGRPANIVVVWFHLQRNCSSTMITSTSPSIERVAVPEA